MPNLDDSLQAAKDKGSSLPISAINQEQAVQAAKNAGVPRDQLLNFIRGGIILQPRQWEMAAAARLCDQPNGPVSIGVGGSRGGGKSHWLIVQLAADDCQRYPGLKCLWLRKEGKSNREHLEDMRRTILRGIPHTYKAQHGSIIFPNQSRIVSGHYQHEKEIDDYLGVEYDVIAIEEATTLLESKYTNIRTCLRSSKPGWRPRDYSTANPGGVGHVWYKNRFIIPQRTGRQTDTRFISSRCQENLFNNADYIKILETLPGWKRKAWLEGNWDIMAGQFFTNWREEIHVLPARFDDRKAHQWFCALDYGMNHYTVCILFAITGEGDIVAVDEHYQRGAVPAWHVQEIRKMLSYHSITEFNQLRYFVAGSDIFSSESSASTVAKTYEDLGMRLKCADMDRVNGWGEMMNRMGDIERNQRPTFFVDRRCSQLIEQIPMMEHDPHRPEDVLKVDIDEYGEGGDDFCDCCRYGINSYRKTTSGSTSSIMPVGFGIKSFNSF